MERNITVTGRFLPVILLAGALLSGCAGGKTLEQAYSFEERLIQFSCSEESGISQAFAGDLCVPAEEDDQTEALTAEAAGVFSLDGGESLFQRNALERMNPASTTKVMTAILALKHGKLSDLVTVTDAALISEAGSSMAGVTPGDQILLEDLLYGLMIPSGNDAANAIAVHIAGSVEAFVEMMNDEAQRIGATGTHFANANGLTDPAHYTTAYDLYLIFHEALKYDVFREIIGARSHTAVYTDAAGEQKVSAWESGNYYMTGKTETPAGLTVFGGKTGTTQAAGYCLIMGTRTDDGREYASVIMKADSRNDLYEDMTKIIDKIVK